MASWLGTCASFDMIRNVHDEPGQNIGQTMEYGIHGGFIRVCVIRIFQLDTLYGLTQGFFQGCDFYLLKAQSLHVTYISETASLASKEVTNGEIQPMRFTPWHFNKIFLIHGPNCKFYQGGWNVATTDQKKSHRIKYIRPEGSYKLSN